MQPAYRVGRDASATQPRRREQVIRIIFTIIMIILTTLMLDVKCHRTSCTRSGLKVQWKLSWRSTPTSSCTPAVSTRSTSRTSRNRRLNVQIAENKPCTGSSCRLPCCQDYWLGAGRKIQPFAFICNPTTKEKSD